MATGRPRLLPLITNTTEMRLATLITVLWFGAVFNVERVVIDGYRLNISNLLYITVALIGVAVVAFPNLRSVRVVFLFGGSLVLFAILTTISGRWNYQFDHPDFLAAELVILLVSTLLLRYLARLLLDLELGLQMFFVQPQQSLSLPFEEGRLRAQQEIQRAQMFNTSLACIYCEVYDPLEPDLDLTKMRENVTEHLEAQLQRHSQKIELGRHIAALVYKSDVIIFFRSGYLIFLPSTAREEARKFINDLSLLLSGSKLQLLAGAAYFPSDGMDFDELIQYARSNTRIYLHQADEADTPREGDVYVSREQRLAIEKDSEWVNNLAYQSASARAIYRVIKRSMDLAAALLVTPFVAPVLGLVALLIYIDDGRPIFYAQERTGYGGRRFKMYKFRSMKMGAASVPPQTITTSDGQVRYVWPEKNDNDPRVTRVGRVLRKTSLDEIPQLWNVLSGDMSLVGPRPTSWNVDMYTLLQTERLSVRPGITGLWQVSARETQNFDERLLWDAKYVEKMSLWLDIQILWRTVAEVVQKKGL